MCFRPLIATRIPIARLPLLALLLVAAILAACGGDARGASDPTDGDAAAPVAIALATSIPSGLDDQLWLPDGVERVIFHYTEVSFDTPSGGTGKLGMMVADTIERRTRGLMHRSGLAPETGMLLAFPVETRSPVWNQDTPMDLEIAFLDLDGVVLAILPLRANDPTLLTPETPYLYTVGMPAGWWAERGAGVGTRFKIPVGVEGLAE